MGANAFLTASRKTVVKLVVCSFLFAFVFVISSHAQSEVFPKWIARFDAAHAADQPSAMAVDGKGDTFVTGATCVVNPCASQNQESLTIAYNSNGNVKWRAFLGQDASGLDIAVDSSGNVYVLSILNASGSPEVAIAKYSPTGARLWVDFLNSTPSVLNNPSTTYRPVKFAVSPEGNVYVAITKVDQIPNPPAGSGPGTTVNAIVVKYDTNGKEIWTKTAPLTPGDSNSALSIHLDAAENVYFLVDDIFNSQIHDCFIVKYNSSGTVLKSFGSSQLGSVDAFRVDASGNSYVAGGGTAQPPNGAEDRIVAKFSSAGVLDWLHDFGSPFLQFNGPSGFTDLAIDSAGDVMVARTIPGAIPSSGGTDISVVKFNSTGTIQWTTRYNGRTDDSGADQSGAIAVNSSDDVYVTGSSSNPAVNCCLAEFATIKYDPNGKQIWATRFNSNGGKPVALNLSGGDVLVAGVGIGATTGADWVTIDYVQDAAKVSPTSLSYGSQKDGTVSASKTVTVTNTSETSLSITGIAITGEFHLTNHCPSTLAAGASCTLGITFDPTTVGALSGTVTVHDNWSGSAVHPQTVKLSGTGTT